MIPDFAENGNLPEGIHAATWQELIARFGGNAHRSQLIVGLKNALRSLKDAGCKKVYIDGSFVTSKELPNDFDCCWEEQGVDGSLLDPVLLDFRNRRASQKVKFLGELFPASNLGGDGKGFIDFFQQDKNTGEQKGLVSMDLGNEKL